MLKLIFWLSLIMLIYTYIGYPVLITVLGRLVRRRYAPPCNNRELFDYPTVSIIISVFNESDVIREKIENCLNIDYPKDRLEILIGSDGSTDGTNDIIKLYRNKGIKCFIAKKRQGKPGISLL